MVDLAHTLFERARATGDEAHWGMVPHWAHLLKSEQSADGDWPAVVNARTGEAVGEARTRRPAETLAELGAWLLSSEFDQAVACARRGHG